MKKNIFFLLLIFITIMGLILRFWDYTDRFGLAYDQAHDALVARFAIQQGKLPLLGPFSSAGPFQTSGTWYWLIMLGTIFNMGNVLAPWIFLTSLCGLMIFGMGLIARKMENESFGLIAAILTAISTAQIAQSVNLTNQTPIPIFSFLTIVCSYMYLKKKSYVSAFGLGLFSACAASIHLQGVALAFIVFWTFCFAGKFKIKHFMLACLGAVLPMLPILIWDSQHGFINVSNMFYYYTKGQFAISLDVLGRRWLTYLKVFWPTEWAHMIGGLPGIAIGIAVLSGLCFVWTAWKRQLKREWVVIFLSFACMVILIRYMRVPIFASFITVTHPFVFLITAWGIYVIGKQWKAVGLIVFAIILAGSIWKTYRELSPKHVNLTADSAKETRLLLKKLYPGEKFAIYDLNYDETRRSVPTALYLEEQGMIDEHGRPIGYIRAKTQAIFHTDIISSSSGLISDLSSSSSATLTKDGWIRVNASDIYRETEDWKK